MFSLFCPRQNFSTCRNALGKIILETLFIQNPKFDGEGKRFGCFSLCFDGVFSTCRNVFPMTFRGFKTKRDLGISIAGGAFSKTALTLNRVFVC